VAGRGAARGLVTKVPAQVGEILEDLRLGRLQIQTWTPRPRRCSIARRRIFSGMVIAALYIAGAIVLASSWSHHGWVAAVMFAVASCAWFVHVGRDWFTAGGARTAALGRRDVGPE